MTTDPTTVERTNWAGNVTFSAARFHGPTSVPELQRIVAGARAVRTLGSGHSFNRIADTAGDLVSVSGLPTVLELDSAAGQVKVSAGTRYGELGRFLQRQGFALHNTGSLPHISVAGASATGTHGSGVGNGNLATIVSAIEIVGPGGDLVSLSRRADGEPFNGMVLALGALGVMTSLTLEVVPTFDIRQDVFEELNATTLDEHFQEIMASGYSVSVFTDWTTPGRYQVWRKSRVDAFTGTDDFFGGIPAAVDVNPVPGMPGENATAQLGVPGPWNERLPHFRLEFTPSSGDELQAEYLLPLAQAAAARQALEEISSLIAPVLMISEFRAIAGDDLWISPSHRQDSVAFHFTFRPDPVALAPVTAAIEAALAPFGARPHWGKVFATAPEVLDTLYPRMDDFRGLLRTYDPAGKFRNELVERLIRV
ncbi:xylitol oxidase [Nakamurella panacisegetis]|uniref:Xylitol oxidase n=1 Tax=Nakamurella panacisegetis TaxID=1090615 RepID=A0A1H0I258_9ACTN|nr:FAD-binding protein [Nakamurella panacisegetis]SDO25161.1 xylitol oxidase [Nakamurella panacisegetis]